MPVPRPIPIADTEYVDHIRDNLRLVEDRLATALARCGRKREEVQLIAVTKTFPAEAMIAAFDAGLRVFGENYVQEFEGKVPLLRTLTGARYHLIGHLQSNKVNKAAPLFHCVQTVDSLRLAQRLQHNGTPMQVMIEVKLSDEESKHGCLPQDLPALVEGVRALPALTLTGLMTIPPLGEAPEASRPYFARLRALAEEFSLSDLSMGMSNDFEVAVEEGATHIRLGTILFGRRSKPA